MAGPRGALALACAFALVADAEAKARAGRRGGGYSIVNTGQGGDLDLAATVIILAFVGLAVIFCALGAWSGYGARRLTRYRARHDASRALEEVSAEGCARLTGIRIAAPLRILEAKACKSLASVWIEPPPERGADDEAEDEDVDVDDDEDAKEKAGRDEGSNPGRLRVDLRNCAALVRLVGVRTAALEGRLEVDLAGCASLPASARPPKK